MTSYRGLILRKGNPFKSIYIAKSSAELLDLAFKRALRASPPGGLKLSIIKKRKSVVITRIKVFSKTLQDKLIEIVKSFPSAELLHPFYKSVMSIWTSIDEYKKRLAKIQGAAQVIKRIERDYIIQVRSIRKKESENVGAFLSRIDRLKREAYGRISSVVKSLDKDLISLVDLVKKMKKLPDLNPELITIVVTGPPNSGKSSLVKRVSNAKVEVASYPFTTKNVTFGHIKLNVNGLTDVLVQIADTPGLFDRPINKRKEPELLALRAIEFIADIIIFLFDGSVEAVMNAEEQLSVYKTVRSFFKSREISKFIIAVNKIDIGNSELIEQILQKMRSDGVNYYLISVLKDQNIDLLLERIRNEVKKLLGRSSNKV